MTPRLYWLGYNRGSALCLIWEEQLSCCSFLHLAPVDALSRIEVGSLNSHKCKIAWDEEEDNHASDQEADESVGVQVLDGTIEVRHISYCCDLAVISNLSKANCVWKTGGVWASSNNVHCLLINWLSYLINWLHDFIDLRVGNGWGDNYQRNLEKGVGALEINSDLLRELREVS